MPTISKHLFPILIIVTLLFSSCSVNRKIAQTANKVLFTDSSLSKAHIGISVYDPSSGKYLYEHNSSNYFVPASNIKILACYAAMRYLGDSLPGIQYINLNNGVLLLPTGDPTLLHPDYSYQPVISFLQKVQGPILINNKAWKTDALGAGWSWGDYNFAYSTERSALPVYGNNIKWMQETIEKEDSSEAPNTPSIFSIPEVEWKVRFNPEPERKNFYVQRNQAENVFTITEGIENSAKQSVPFVTYGIQSAIELLKDTIGKQISITDRIPTAGQLINTIYSVKLDAVLKPMMYNSDNFISEQVLLMVSNKRFAVFSEDIIIDSMLNRELKDLPQQPSWADGSGLSRYNLFSPNDFALILAKMQAEFGMERLKNIFPTGGQGTFTNYYKQDSGYFYAKTGSLNGVIALSGYLYAKNGRLLTFSVLINNYRGPASLARRQVEKLIQDIRLRY